MCPAMAQVCQPDNRIFAVANLRQAQQSMAQHVVHSAVSAPAIPPHAPVGAGAARWLRIGRWLLAAWALVAFAIVGSLAAAHWYALPRPVDDQPDLVRALAARRQPQDSGRWLATHVLYSECQCSRRIVEHLATRRARTDVSESVLLVGPESDYSARMRAAGYRVELLEPLELVRRYKIQAAPLLIVSDPRDVIRYMGGYTERKQGLAMRDGEIIDALYRGQQTSELPLFGCAVSRSLQKLLDPWNLKYASGRKDDD